MKKTVPLVIIANGGRREIGEATVDTDTGEVTAIVDGDELVAMDPVSVSIKTSLQIRPDEDLSETTAIEIVPEWPPAPVTIAGTIGSSWHTDQKAE